MALPFFHLPFIDNTETLITLDEETSKHVVSVLRMQRGEQLHLTDGKGNLLTAEITDDHKRMCVVRVTGKQFINRSPRQVAIAISLLKNGSRFEWFIEKAAELGISDIIPLLCERTEKLHCRFERKVNIIISAMLQSGQVWKTTLHEPKTLDAAFSHAQYGQKFIAHCSDESKTALSRISDASVSSQIIFIGPEGDFTKEEIELARQHQCIPVSLGDTRLRSETAGIVAAAILKSF